MEKYAVGIDFGCTGVKAGIVDKSYSILAKSSMPIGRDHDFGRITTGMVAMIHTLMERSGISPASIEQIGIGCPGFVDPKTGNIAFINNLGWWNAPLPAVLKEKLSMPVSIYTENDANCAVIGEMLAGAGIGKGNIVLLTLGTGVGGGIILNGKLYSGSDNMGAELGHVPLKAGGKLCSCGKRGCLEAYASVTALIHQTHDAMKNNPDSALHQIVRDRCGIIDGRTAFDCARLGDETALRVVDRYIDYVAQGIAGFINIFRPEIVLIGGGLSNEGSYLIDPINAKMKDYVFSFRMIGSPPVEACKLGNDAGIIGAAYMRAFLERGS